MEYDYTFAEDVLKYFVRSTTRLKSNPQEGAARSLTVSLIFQSVYNLLGETLSRLQQYAEAERWFQASLASQPDHVPAHITYGKLLARNVSSYQF